VTAPKLAAAAALTSKATREENPIYLFWHGHVAGLLGSAAGPELDADFQAHLILGALHAAPIGRLLRDGQAERVAASLRQMAGALLAGRTEPGVNATD
jgi:hypothetical protein